MNEFIMALEIYHIIILIVVGALVGISISFIGQTGQGIVLPIILLLTGDVFLAIAINLLNDVITSAAVSIGYLRKKKFAIRIDILIVIVVAIMISFLGVYILMTTALGSIFGWFIPAFIMVLGLLFLKRGFPTHESVKKMIQNLARKTLKTEKNEEGITELNKKIEEQLITETNSIEGFISRGSRMFYILALGFGILIGLNSGLFGASSGLIFVLVLVILYGYPLKKGVGTALILSIVIGSCTFLFYQILGLTVKGQLFLHLELSLYLAIGSIISGIITSIYVQKLSAITMGRAVGFVIFILGSLALVFFFIT
ncbi:MAG: sulfite exporter TauE/SafE family protein [Candidatus Lokiarchaeota archaeon]|nr:sulfite exporter TauE/SafE family protein [Candidatus Lokiarchaeota archaeon]